MNILKMKSIFKLFIALALVGVLVTSCEKEAIIEDTAELKTLIESESNLENAELLQSRMSCSNFGPLANSVLIALAQEIENCAANGSKANKDAIINRYNYYRLSVLEPCLPQPVVVPVLSFDNNPNTSCPFGQGSCSDGSAAINTLEWFLCHLGNFIENPNSFQNQNNVENAFNYYAGILRTCFGAPITAKVDI